MKLSVREDETSGAGLRITSSAPPPEGRTMSLTSHLIQRMLRLDTPSTRQLTVDRGLRVPMPDGVELLADRWAPRAGGDDLPTAVIRTPYGRRGTLGTVLARPLAERGFQVLLQSTRGTFGSGGTLDPLRCEREDGLATLEWVAKQPWFADTMVLFGLSYLGYAQWAMADRLPPSVKAMIPQVSESALTMEFLRADGISLETPFDWGVLVATQERRWAMMRHRLGAKRLHRALHTVPLTGSDLAVLGHRSAYIQDILAHDSDADRWAGIDHSHRVPETTVPVSSIAGWFDIFLPGQLRDYQALRAAGRDARLTVGPWTHTAPEVIGTAIREATDFGLAHAKGEQPARRAPVRLYVMGGDSWHDFDSWPPAGYSPRRYHLQPDATMSTEPPGRSEPDRYRYDPADPTPAVGGIRMTGSTGPVDNAALESRPDVLTYTTSALEHGVEVIGEVSAEIYFRSSLPYADVFVRLCDVDPRGRSSNVCDGLVSLTGADEIRGAQVRLWPTAYRFKRGHRIRIQVSSGAFPRFARNPGTGQPRATTTTLVPALQEVYHDPEHPSAVILPVRLSDGRNGLAADG
jgi:putative CocE/NonD family hydrolase